MAHRLGPSARLSSGQVCKTEFSDLSPVRAACHPALGGGGTRVDTLQAVGGVGVGRVESLDRELGERDVNGQ